MQTLQIIADNPKSALEQIHRQLGPEAVVLSVRRLPVHGVARLWQQNGPVEILAGVPDATLPGESRKPSFPEPGDTALAAPSGSNRRWQTVEWLEAMGLMPAYARRLRHHLDSLQPAAPASLDAEWETVLTALSRSWPAPPPPANPSATRTHVFVGPPGSGKTTVLCKWLTLAVLTEERSARVWRLNGAGANTTEFLSMHCEMLDVPVDRFWSQTRTPADLHFIDLPGVETDDPRALSALRNELSTLPSPEIHLVLNAAYETETLLKQCRVFGALQPADLILTHLDEETRRVKLWNLVFGTNCTILFLSAGQKIPGEFHSAAPELLFPSETSQQQADPPLQR